MVEICGLYLTPDYRKNDTDPESVVDHPNESLTFLMWMENFADANLNASAQFRELPGRVQGSVNGIFICDILKRQAIILPIARNNQLQQIPTYRRRRRRPQDIPNKRHPLPAGSTTAFLLSSYLPPLIAIPPTDPKLPDPRHRIRDPDPRPSIRPDKARLELCPARLVGRPHNC